RMYKECLSCWLESGIPNLGIWPKRIHTTAEKYEEYEAQKQTDQTQAQELCRSQDRDFETMAKLHTPVMVDEVVHCHHKKDRFFLDMTFGSGGHTKAILQKESDIVLYALDTNPTAYALAEHLSELYPKQIRAMLGQFSQAEALLMKAGVQPGTFDGVLMDLGCSSMQLDTPERFFPSERRRYPDMPTAADVVNALDQQALASILRTYGEEKHAKKIASAVVQARSICLSSLPTSSQARKDLLQRPTHIATKTFQALRIFVNNELNELYTGLKTAQKFLRPGGRLVTLSFHSLQDCIQVMKTLQLSSDHENTEEASMRRAPLMWELIYKKVLSP
uniref:Methyltransferase like 15 n=1 Tax=Gorilla gorilla gorilla TaxID=9595 RepID=A0A2I2Z3W5_GORGO